VTQQRFDNVMQQLRATTQELTECKRALTHCRASNRPLPCPPCQARTTRRASTLAAREIRGVSPPLSEAEYEVPQIARAAASATPGHTLRTAATIRRRRDTPSVSARAQTYGPTPRNRTQRASRHPGARQTMI